MPFGFLVAEYANRRRQEGSSGVIHQEEQAIEALFLPNRGASNTSMWVLFGIWVALFLFVWSTMASGIFPSPTEVLGSIPGLWNEDGLGAQLWASFSLNLEAAGIMFLLSLAIAYSTVMPAFRPLAKLISSGRFNGFVGLPLIFMAIFHNPHVVKVCLLVFGMGVFTVLSLTKMIKDIPQSLFDHSRTLRMREWRVVWEVVVLGRFDEVMDIMRINIAMGWMMLPMVEGMFKYEGGVGALMENESKHLNLDAVFAVLFVILVVGFVQDYLIGYFKGIICPYAEIGLERK